MLAIFFYDFYILIYLNWILEDMIFDSIGRLSSCLLEEEMQQTARKAMMSTQEI